MTATSGESHLSNVVMRDVAERIRPKCSMKLLTTLYLLDPDGVRKITDPRFLACSCGCSPLPGLRPLWPLKHQHVPPV